MKNILKTALTFAASAILFTSCERKNGMEDKPGTVMTPIVNNPPGDTTSNSIPSIVYHLGDTTTLMVRDIISDESGSTSSNFYLEQLEVETGVHYSETPRGIYSPTGGYKINFTAPPTTVPTMETGLGGYTNDTYRNFTHTNALGYNNTVLPVKTFISRNDGGVVAYGLQPNASGGMDTVKTARVLCLVAAEKVVITSAPVSGVNPMNNGSNNTVSYNENLSANRSIGQNGLIFTIQ